MLIDGTLVDSDGRIDVVNPATGEAFASAPDCTDALLDRAIEAGRRAFKGWRNTPIAQRQACLHKAADILTENAEQLARIFTREQGRPTDAAKSEIDIAVAWLHAYAEMAPPVEVIDKGAGQRIETHYVSLGVVCTLPPWHLPVNHTVWKIAA